MPVLETPPSVHAASVVDRREPAPGVVILGLEAPLLASTVRPGQFVMVVPPGGERIATALAIYEASGRRVSLMLVVVGPRTAELAGLTVGAPLELVGPLGNGFDLAELGDDVALLAGGVGIASLYLLAHALSARGAHPHLYYGARDGQALVDVERFEAFGVRVMLSTDDGSRGMRGFVTDIPDLQTKHFDAIAACGPSPMLRAAGRLATRRGIRAQLSLEETFACGVGACWGCVVPLDRASAQALPFPAPGPREAREYVHARICTEGPVFWAHELRW